METESEQNSTSANGSTASSASSRPQISQMSLYERQAVQALQALHRQPNAAQYFHQLMLQQQLSNAQLHSLAAVQQATIAATRQAASPNTVSNQQTSTTQGSQANLSTSSSAQLLSRAQNVTAPSATTLTQSVLLSNASSPPLSQSQTQMYLRQPQLGNLLQVNRSLNRGVPLNSQLILMPNGSVATVQQEVASPQNQGMHQDSDQVQNLAVRGQQTAQPTSTAAGSTIAHAAPPQSKPTAHSAPSSSAPSQLTSSPVPHTVKSPMGPAGGTVSQGSQTEAEGRKAEGEAVQQSVGINLTRAATPAPNQTLISSATYTHIQPHSVLQQKQVVFQQQIAIHQHRQSQLVHASAHLQLAQQQPQAPSQQGMQATPAQQTLVVQPMLQTPEATLPTKAPVPIQPKQPGKGVPPLNLQGHLAAKPTQSARPLPTPPPNQPHIPVQLVGARQQGPAQALALGAPQVPSQGSSLTQITLPQSPAPVPSAVSGAVQEAQAAFYGVLQGKMSGAGKRKSEEDREESPTLPVKASPPADTAPTVEERSAPADKSETASQVSSALTVSAPPCAPTLSVTSRQHSDSKPPQAIVKPQILTHIIEGFVIQEGAEPFPVGSPQIPKDPEKLPALVTALPPIESLPPHPAVDQTVSDSGGSKLLKCEYCGKFAPADQFRGSKRFCSMTCAKRYNVSCSHQFRLKRKKLNQLQEAGGVRVRRRGPRRNSSEIARAKIQGKRMRLTEEDSSRGSDNSSYEEAFSPTSPAPPSCRTPQRERDGSTPTSGPSNSELLGINPVFLSSNPSRWSVEEVYEFISSLQGCQDLAEDFRSQEIDGQALLLLKEEHLMSALNIKLGPALKICAKINLLKET